MKITLERLGALAEMAVDGAAEGALFEMTCEEAVEILGLAVSAACLLQPTRSCDPGPQAQNDPGQPGAQGATETSDARNPGPLPLAELLPGNEPEAVGMAGTGNSAQAPTGDVRAPVGIAASLRDDPKSACYRCTYDGCGHCTLRVPDCCIVSDGATLAEQLYCAYNLAGANPGLNYQGKPCPTWDKLPADVRHKWEAVAEHVTDLISEDALYCSDADPGVEERRGACVVATSRVPDMGHGGLDETLTDRGSACQTSPASDDNDCDDSSAPPHGEEGRS